MGIFESLACWIRWLAAELYYYMVEAVEFVLDALLAVVGLLIALLPRVALERPDLDQTVLGIVNYVIPVGEILVAFGVIMMAWIIYRIYQIMLRWAKADG